MRYIILLCLLIIPAFYMEGKPVSEHYARKIATNYYSRSASAATDDISIAKTIRIRSDEVTTIYIFNFTTGGFVIVSADDAVIPILGYSPKGVFSIDNMPSNIDEWIKNYSRQILQLSMRNSSHLQKKTDYWERIINKEFPKEVKSVSPLLSTTWNQDCYYNNFCPVASTGPCERAYAGCVATAMAQVMRYHSYPSKGSGTHGFEHDLYGYLHADFGNTVYEWTNMPEFLNINSNQADIEAVSILIYHCGVAVDMDYGPTGSSAGLDLVREALVNYFNYLGTAKIELKSNYSNEEWADLLRNNLDASLPVLYRGADDENENGHLFVIDGYQEQGSYFDHFHINWGWGGQNDGFYYIYNLAPPGSVQFNYYQYAIVNIEPILINPLPISKDFQDNDINSGGWTVAAIENSWLGYFPWYVDFYNNKYYAKVSAYLSSTYYPSESWLISPKFRNNLRRKIYLSFDNATKWPGPALQTLISLDWDGNESNVTSASWHVLSPVLSPGDWKFVNSGVLDLSGYIGSNIHIAFRYTSTNWEAATWEIDNIRIYENTIGIEEMDKGDSLDISLYPNPGSISMTIESRFLKGELNLSLVTVTGEKVLDQKVDFSGKYNLDISSLPVGLYLLSLQRVDGQRFSYRMVKTE